MAAPDAQHVYWCSKCGTLARVAPGETPAGRMRIAWLLPVGMGEAKKSESATSATSDLADIITGCCRRDPPDVVKALLKRVIDERLREIFGDTDATT